MTSDWWYQLPCLRVPHHHEALSLVTRLQYWPLIGWLATCHQPSCSQSSNSPHKCTTIWTKATHIFAPCSFICMDREIFHISHIQHPRVLWPDAFRSRQRLCCGVQSTKAVPGVQRHQCDYQSLPPWSLISNSDHLYCVLSGPGSPILHSDQGTHVLCGQDPPSPVTASDSVLQSCDWQSTSYNLLHKTYDLALILAATPFNQSDYPIFKLR